MTVTKEMIEEYARIRVEAALCVIADDEPSERRRIEFSEAIDKAEAAIDAALTAAPQAVVKPLDENAIDAAMFASPQNLFIRSGGVYHQATLSSDDVARIVNAYFGALTTPPAQAVGVAEGWTLAELQRAHIERQKEWCPDQQPDLSFRGNELGGECGEALNVIKKLERERHGWRGSRDTVEHLAEELADVIHCTTLVAITAGVDLQQAVIDKFNSTSLKNGLTTLLAASPTPPADDLKAEQAYERGLKDGDALIQKQQEALHAAGETLQRMKDENERLREEYEHLKAEKLGIAKNATSNIEYWKVQYEQAETRATAAEAREKTQRDALEVKE